MMYRICLLAVFVLASCSRTEPAPPPPATPAPTATPAPAPAPAAPAPTPPPAAAPKPIDSAKARELIAGGKAIVLDVRTPDEYGEDHIASAKNVPVDELDKRLAEVDKLVKSDKAQPIVVYCAAGKRAARAKQTLEGAGYTNVVNGGGLDDLR
jgi:phage shock protein E